MRIILALAAAALTLNSTPAGATTTPPAVGVASVLFPRGLPAALYEDECAGVPRCVWNARHRGNGTSYILVRRDGVYDSIQITAREALWLTNRYCARLSVDCRYAN